MGMNGQRDMNNCGIDTASLETEQRFKTRICSRAGILPLLPPLLNAFELSRLSNVPSYAVQVTGSPVGKGPMGISAAVWTLFERPSNDFWTFLIAAAVDVAKESLSLSRPSTELADSVIKPRRLVWLLDSKE